jgi:hypothetical protein
MGKMETMGEKPMIFPKDEGKNVLTPLWQFVVTIIVYHRVTDMHGNSIVVPVKRVLRG